MNNMRTEHWRGYTIRFVRLDDGHWWAVLKDICDALKLRTNDVVQRLDPSMLERVPVETEQNRPTHYKKNCETGSNGIAKVKNTIWMLAVNQHGIYQALFASRKLEARKFQLWTFDILDKLRSTVGLQEYETMQMTEPEIQEEIDWILDSLYWDEERGCVMESYTVAGGDVEQRPFGIEEEEE